MLDGLFWCLNLPDVIADLWEVALHGKICHYNGYNTDVTHVKQEIFLVSFNSGLYKGLKNCIFSGFFFKLF